jgi:hypothetical protein
MCQRDGASGGVWGQARGQSGGARRTQETHHEHQSNEHEVVAQEPVCIWLFDWLRESGSRRKLSEAAVSQMLRRGGGGRRWLVAARGVKCRFDGGKPPPATHRQCTRRIHSQWNSQSKPQQMRRRFSALEFQLSERVKKEGWAAARHGQNMCVKCLCEAFFDYNNSLKWMGRAHFGWLAWMSKSACVRAAFIVQQNMCC